MRLPALDTIYCHICNEWIKNSDVGGGRCFVHKMIYHPPDFAKYISLTRIDN